MSVIDDVGPAIHRRTNRRQRVLGGCDGVTAVSDGERHPVVQRLGVRGHRRVRRRRGVIDREDADKSHRCGDRGRDATGRISVTAPECVLGRSGLKHGPPPSTSVTATLRCRRV